MPIYVGKNVTVTITSTSGGSSGDMGAFLAQELTIEPKQAVEAIDALGSDTIEEWAMGLKTFEGTIKEPLDMTSGGSAQLARFAALEDVDFITEYTMELDWGDPDSGGISLTLTGVIFPEPSIATPKNAPTMVTSKFKARTCVLDYDEGGS